MGLCPWSFFTHFVSLAGPIYMVGRTGSATPHALTQGEFIDRLNRFVNIALVFLFAETDNIL
jgi:hypothetical protein